MWTRFMDMHSGGGSKEKHEYIYIEAPEDEAKVILFNRFGHNPERVSCTCCGEDYSISDAETLEQLTAYDRGCAWNDNGGYDVESGKRSLDEYLADPSVLVIRAGEIKSDERKGSVPAQGYIWQD